MIVVIVSGTLYLSFFFPHGYDIIWGVMSHSIPAKIVSDVKAANISFDEAVVKMQKQSSMKQLYIGNQDICDRLNVSNVYIRKGDAENE